MNSSDSHVSRKSYTRNWFASVDLAGWAAPLSPGGAAVSAPLLELCARYSDRSDRGLVWIASHLRHRILQLPVFFRAQALLVRWRHRAELPPPHVDRLVSFAVLLRDGLRKGTSEMNVVAPLFINSCPWTVPSIKLPSSFQYARRFGSRYGKQGLHRRSVTQPRAVVAGWDPLDGAGRNADPRG